MADHVAGERNQVQDCQHTGEMPVAMAEIMPQIITLGFRVLNASFAICQRARPAAAMTTNFPTSRNNRTSGVLGIALSRSLDIRHAVKGSVPECGKPTRADSGFDAAVQGQCCPETGNQANRRAVRVQSGPRSGRSHGSPPEVPPHPGGLAPAGPPFHIAAYAAGSAAAAGATVAATPITRAFSAIRADLPLRPRR